MNEEMNVDYITEFTLRRLIEGFHQFIMCFTQGWSSEHTVYV